MGTDGENVLIFVQGMKGGERKKPKRYAQTRARDREVFVSIAKAFLFCQGLKLRVGGVGRFTD